MQLVAWTTIKKRIPIKLDINPDEDVAENDSCANQSIIAEQKGTNKPVVVPGSKENGKVQDTAKVAVVKKRQENTKSKDTSYPKIIFHKVQPGDTLWNIAQRYRSTIQKIKRANRINGNSIKTGTNLKIPVVS